jgi:hypothetical protein
VISIDSGLALLTRQVDLGGPAAAGPAQAVIGRLITRRLDLAAGVPAGTGGVLVRPRDRGVHRHIPGDQARRVGELLQPCPHLRPGAVAPEETASPLTAATCRAPQLSRLIASAMTPPSASAPSSESKYLTPDLDYEWILSSAVGR